MSKSIQGERIKLKSFLDEMAARYNCKEFIKNDPVQFPHAFGDRRDIEIAALLASVIAWGNRRMIINSGNKMFYNIMHGCPYEYVMGAEWESADDTVNIHRTFFMRDLKYLCRGLHHIYSKYESMETVFRAPTTWDGIENFRSLLMEANGGDTTRHISNPTATKGHPASACKRLHMMLRWLCRRDGIVDLGLWTGINPSELMIPIDVHVSRISRRLGLLERKQNDRKSVEMLTEELRKLSPDDPVKYDFALFGIGVEESNNKE